MSQQYYVTGIDGREYGPASEELLEKWFRERRIHALSRLRSRDGGESLCLRDLPHFCNLRKEEAPAIVSAGPQPEAASPQAGNRRLPPLQTVPAQEAPRPKGPLRRLLSPFVISLLASLIFLPFGIMGLVFTIQQERCHKSRNTAGAVSADHERRLWNRMAFTVGIALVVMWILWTVFTFAQFNWRLALSK